jgi:hypothetical protein
VAGATHEQPGVDVTITDENARPLAMPPAARTVEGPTFPTRSERRRLRKVAAWVVGCGILIGAAGGYVTVHIASEPAVGVRARSADSARLQAQADAYFAQPAATVRARSADSARLQAQADAYFAE